MLDHHYSLPADVYLFAVLVQVQSLFVIQDKYLNWPGQLILLGNPTVQTVLSVIG